MVGMQVSLARPSCDSIKGANLYIGGLPKHMTNHDLFDLFAPCGQIITARVLCDPKTGNVQAEELLIEERGEFGIQSLTQVILNLPEVGL